MRLLPKAVLFDHDGVLVASEPLHWEAWELLLKELDLPYEQNEIRRYVGRTAPEIMETILNRHRPDWKASEYDLNELAKRKNDHYLELARAGLRANPGVPEGLEWLKAQGVKIGVVSNAKKRELEAALTQLGLARHFDVILSRDDVPSPKPDPAPYLFGAACLETEPFACLAVEDSPPGLEAALLARIPTVAVMTNFPREALTTPVPGRPDLKPEWIGNSMSDLFEWLKSLCGC